MTTKLIKVGTGRTTPVHDTKPQVIKVDMRSIRLAEITRLVRENNRANLSTEVIVCQIYMESRFDKNAHSQGSSAKGLMQLLKAPVRELYRLENLRRPVKERQSESVLYARADAFHDSAEILDEATNIQIGTKYLQHLIDKNASHPDPIAEAYKDYRGLRNGIYYSKIKAAAEKLKESPTSMQPLEEMVK